MKRDSNQKCTYTLTRTPLDYMLWKIMLQYSQGYSKMGEAIKRYLRRTHPLFTGHVKTYVNAYTSSYFIGLRRDSDKTECNGQLNSNLRRDRRLEPLPLNLRPGIFIWVLIGFKYEQIAWKDTNLNISPSKKKRRKGRVLLGSNNFWDHSYFVGTLKRKHTSSTMHSGHTY